MPPGPPRRSSTTTSRTRALEGEGKERYRAGLLAGFRLIEQRPDVRTLLLGEPGADAINGLAVLGVEQGLSPERLTDLAMDVLWPGIEALAR